MTHVRETIEALSSVLKHVLDTAVSAEMFRKAKFDQPEATEHMWRALSSLLGFHNPGKPTASQNPAQAVRSQLVSICRHEMFKKGYRAADFFRLPCDMSRGSRDVLLALGWFLAKDYVLEMLISCIEPVNTEDPPFDLLLAEKIAIPCAALDTSLALNSRGSLEQRTSQLMQQLVLMNGKLSASLRMLWSSRNEYAKLTSKVLTATTSKPSEKQPALSENLSSRHLSVFEVYLLRYPKEMVKYQATLEHQNCCINSLLVWIEKESLFWKWMESVLEAKLKGFLESSTQEDNQDFNLTELEHKPSAALQKAKSHQVELSGLFQSQEHVYKSVAKTWKKMRTEMGGAEGLERDKGDAVKSLDRELVEQIEQLQIEGDDTGGGGSCPAAYQHLRYTPKPQMTHRSYNQTDAALEIKRLSEEVCSLEKELRTLQQRNKEKMLKFSEKFENIICIPPQF